MKKLALTVIVFFALVGVVPSCFAIDVFLPDGCYVAFSDPDYCYSPGTGNTLIWAQGSNRNLLAQQYGWAMAIVISQDFETWQKFSQCFVDYNNVTALYNGCINDNSAIAADYAEVYRAYTAWKNYSNKQAKLIKKLRKACGPPCKRIK